MKKEILAIAIAVSFSTTAIASDNYGVNNGDTSNENLIMNEGNSTSTTVGNVTSLNSTTFDESVSTAYAPSVQVGGQDMCRSGMGAGGQTSALGFSFGGSVVDMTCERLKLAREIAVTLGDKQTAKALLCQDERVAKAYASIGKACPVGSFEKQSSNNTRPDMSIR